MPLIGLNEELKNMAHIVLAHYQDLVVSFTEEAWFNATAVAEKYGKRPVHLTSNPVKRYLFAGRYDSRA
jgi:hypothetical protein